MGKYIDLRCDFGFKYCMSDPIIMKSFLNAILEGDEDKITKVKFDNVEKPASHKHKRGVIFDLYCTTSKGDSILIEMQNSCHKFFKTRANFYVYKLMDSKIKKGFAWKNMKKDISKIIGIFIMGKNMDGIDKVVTRTAECDLDTGKMFWDRHRKYFVSLPKFEFDANNITTKNIWINFFKNLGSMENIDPSVYKRADKGLLRLIEKAKVCALSEKDQKDYDASLKALADEINMREDGYEEGLEEGIGIGREEERVKMAKKMKLDGVDDAIISKYTDLSIEEIEKL